MEKNQSIEQVLESLDNNKVFKSKNSPLPGIVILIIGIILLIAYSTIEWKPTAILPQVLFVMGLTCIVVGIFKFFIRKTHFVSATNQQKMKIAEIYFHVSERDKLVRLLDNKDIIQIKQLNHSIGDGLKLRIMATADGSLCYSQAVAYVSNEYTTITPVQEHSTDEYRILAGIIQSRK